MWSFETVLLSFLCVTVLFLTPCTPAPGSQSRYGEECKLDDVTNACGINERCKQEKLSISAKCTCQQGFEYVNKTCIRISPVEVSTSSSNIGKSDVERSNSEDGNSLVTMFLLIPTFVAALGAFAYFGIRRYKCMQQFNQFQQNRYNSVLVTRDDTDDDDPPIA